MILRRLATFAIVALCAMPVMAADDKDDDNKLPLPRFASLRSNEANMRTGPGTRYPILWVYKRRGLPVEITAEHDVWRRVRDPEGVEGWISRIELTGKRQAIVMGDGHILRERANDQADIEAHLENGAIGKIQSCDKEWCEIKFDEAKGYLRKSEFWGAYPAEVFD